VVWGVQLPRQLYCTIGGDNVAGGRLATEHLIEGGRRRIAFFGDIRLPEVAQRYEGYALALKRHGLPLDPQFQISVSFLPRGGTEAVQEMTRRALDCDAIFACSDLLAITAIHALRERGLRIPQDIAVVGYDDIELAAYCNPPLTTVRQPIQAAGHRLVAALLSLIEGNPTPSQQLETELVCRDSSAA
jgi:DNA-binding LacI/PurR family transcriptional regulator